MALTVLGANTSLENIAKSGEAGENALIYSMEWWNICKMYKKYHETMSLTSATTSATASATATFMLVHARLMGVAATLTWTSNLDLQLRPLIWIYNLDQLN